MDGTEYVSLKGLDEMENSWRILAKCVEMGGFYSVGEEQSGRICELCGR